jgi:predicted DCC family thiol-disulfide oxidoreductase YuxK/uncharacterized membrane protein YphA (DoxX/SURF4 family)
MHGADSEPRPSAPRPLLVWDGDCGFCARAVRWLERSTGDRVEIVPYQECTDPRIPIADCAHAVHLAEPDGRVTRAAAACFRAFSYAPGKRWVAWPYRFVPGFAWLAERGYASVAAHRAGLSQLLRLVSGPDPAPSSWLAARRMLAVLLGLAYLATFVSLGTQVVPLLGVDGIAPAAELAAAGRLEGPSVLRVWNGDAVLILLCALGASAGVALALGLAPRWALGCGWLALVSLSAASRELIAHDGDLLLLEASIPALLVLPAGVRPRGRWQTRPATAGMLLLRLLLVRVMLTSGLAKLGGITEPWSSLRGPQQWLYTQPLPAPLALTLWRDGSPQLGQAVAVTVMVVELVLALFALGPRRFRLVALAGFSAWQVALALTGNHGVQNLVLLALCTTLLDDQTVRAIVPGALRRRLPEPAWRAVPVTVQWVRAIAAAAILGLAVQVAGHSLWPSSFDKRWMQRVERALEPFRLVNAYEPLAAARWQRRQPVIEVSEDGESWRPLWLTAAPGPIDRPLPVCGLHLPRLDHALCAAAPVHDFGPAPPWLDGLLCRVLEGDRAVLGLFAERAAARAVRVRLWDYRFASARDHYRRRHVWRAEELAMWVAPRELRGGRLVRVE